MGQVSTVLLCVATVINSSSSSTRGLDASTALEFVRALRIATDIAKMTTIVSLYQAGESLYRVFDKVSLICCLTQLIANYSIGMPDLRRQNGVLWPRRSSTRILYGNGL